MRVEIDRINRGKRVLYPTKIWWEPINNNTIFCILYKSFPCIQEHGGQRGIDYILD